MIEMERERNLWEPQLHRQGLWAWFNKHIWSLSFLGIEILIVIHKKPLLFNMLSRFVIAFLPRSKHLLISWLQSPFALILESKKIQSPTISFVSPSICHDVMGLDAMILFSEHWVLSQLFHSPVSLASRGSLVLLYFRPWGWYHLHIWGYWCFFCNLHFSLSSIQSRISHDVLCV